MKTTAKKIAKDESGKILILVLVLLVVGGLLLGPLLGLMSTGLASGQVYEKKAAELYAADAGVEDAIWKIANKEADFDGDGYYAYPDSQVAEVWVVNEKSVDVEIYRVETPESTPCHRIYRHLITSNATSDDGSTTTIQAYLTATIDFADLSGLMDHIITIKDTPENITKLETELGKVNFACVERCQNCTDPCGTVYDYQDLDKDDPCYGCGAVYNYNGWWPTPTMLSEYYLPDVAGYPYFLDKLYVQDYSDGIGPLYRDGKLDIINDGTAVPTLKLNDTVYVTGDTTVGGSKGFTVDLNGHTIFIKSPSRGSGKEALKIDNGVTSILGPGAIVAVGDIYFAPGVEIGTNGKPVFVFSVAGETTVQPNATFYGAVAGDFYVDVGSGQGPEGPTFTYPPGGFGDDFDFFPSMVEVNRMYDLVSWTIGPA